MRNYGGRMDLSALLQTTFGFPAFRANQEAVCRAATEGRDVLLVMPTGAGKSLCYQLPAIARGGTGLVVSPLIALMDDQAAKLSAAGLKVARIHSGLSRDDARQACRDYLDGRLNFLFIAPERMRVPGFPEMLAKRKPALIAIDEAHCISQWGHDFRPDYRTLGDHLPALRPAPIIALTATATPQVQKDIAAQLNLQSPALFIHGFRRDNLHIEAVEMSKPRRNEFAKELLARPGARPAIVYAPSRRAAEELAPMLGRRAAAYHAGLDASVRESVQRQFQAGQLEVVVATIAFGMGIDKADVRTVVHLALPASVEAYYQEIGRAGRDGAPSKAILLYSFVDRRIHESFLERDYPPSTELNRVASVLTGDFLMPEPLARKIKLAPEVFAKSVEKLASHGAAQIDLAGNVRATGTTGWAAGYESQVAFRRSQIERIFQYAETHQCRMTALIRHFGDLADATKPCGHCDFCSPEGATAQPFAAPTAEQDRQLRAILRALEGNTSRATGRLYTDMALKIERKQFDGLLDALARAGLISLTAETFTNAEGKVLPYKKASLTHEGKTLDVDAPLPVVLREQAYEPAARSTRKSQSKTLSTQAPPLYNEAQKTLETSLREWRKAEAAKLGKPAFILFGDRVLGAIVQAQPRTMDELRGISGIGPEKADKYGRTILALCSGTQVPAAAPASKPSLPKARPSEEERIGDLPAFTRPRQSAPDPAAALTPDQQALDQRLRDWRKAESDRMGLPQFFILGSSTLRSIVLKRPRSLPHLLAIDGFNQEKADQFGDSILSLCNGETFV
jgi:ATP-dependent DNA helicase RecQ